MTDFPWFSDREIDDMCSGLTTSAAKVRFLRNQGLTVARKPNGRPLVMRDQAQKILSGLDLLSDSGTAAPVTQPAHKPNRERFKLLYGQKAAKYGAHHGSKT